MASCGLNYYNARRAGKETLGAKQSALKWFNAQLAVDCLAYTMFICQF